MNSSSVVEVPQTKKRPGPNPLPPDQKVQCTTIRVYHPERDVFNALRGKAPACEFMQTLLQLYIQQTGVNLVIPANSLTKYGDEAFEPYKVTQHPDIIAA